ncbi:MAG: glucokinase [Verrucomicrobiota bacterium]|nr:glucokinase [Verrucomicrobiota bacterium]
MILVGDIGGTHTRLALFEVNAELHLLEEKKFHSRKYVGLEEIAKQFLGSHQVVKACFGVAGAVYQGRCHATNLPWVVDAAELSRHLHIPKVHLLNDLEANAYGVGVVKPSELCVIQEGRSQIGNQALIAAGTGLGEAGIIWNGKAHLPFACEGGHCDFAPRNALEIELFLFLKKKFEHISYERVVSGPGLHSIYQFLVESGYEQASPEVTAKMKEQDPPAVISEYGRLAKDKACQRAVDCFLSLYGSEAGNLALKFLSVGGLFIGGGIAPHLCEKMKTSEFLSSFSAKGRFRPLLESIRITVILNDSAALLGAADFARNS